MAGRGCCGSCAGGILAWRRTSSGDDEDLVMRYHTCMEFDEDLSQEERTAAVRQQVLMDLLQASDGDRGLTRKVGRTFTNEQMRDIVDFRSEYFTRSGRSESRRFTQESIQGQSSGPWGVPSGHGSGSNSWGAVD